VPKFLRLVKLLAFASIPILVVASIFIPAMTRVVISGNPPQLDSAWNEEGLIRCCQQYAIDHNGNFPPSLEDIFPTYCTGRSYLVSPFLPSDPIGYAYTRGLKDTAPPHTILVEDKFAPFKNYRIVGYVNGKASIIPMR
jgi:hypothetical protein